MAKNKQKAPLVRRVTKNEERRRPSAFHSIKDGEKMVGFALFEPDAELAVNPGYYEYFSHYDRQARTRVPCTGENCPMCEDGNNPSTVALSLWYLPDNPKAEQVKIFSLNGTTIDDFVDEAEEQGGIQGKKYRIKRRGTDTNTRYKVSNLNEKLPKKEVTAILKAATAEIDLEAIVEKQARVQLERLRAVRALEDDDDMEEVDVDEDDDDDDDDEEETTAKKGKAVEPDDDDDDDDDDDETADDDDDDDAESDDDDDDDADDDADSDDDDDDDESSEMEGEKVEIVSIDEEEETFEVKHADLGKFTLFLPEGLELDFDDYAKKDVLTINAVKDDEGDWILTEEPTKAKAKGGGKGKGKGKTKAKK